MQSRLERSFPAANRLIESAVHKRQGSHFSLASYLTRQLENSKWRKLGLVRDDMIVEENDIVVEALKRIPKEQVRVSQRVSLNTAQLWGRYARYKVAIHQNLLRRELPEQQWITHDQDKSYLMPFVEQVLAEHTEMEQYNQGVFTR